MADKNKLSDKMLRFDMADAQEFVDAYVACGRYVEALRLLRCMKDIAVYDVELLCFNSSDSVSSSLYVEYLECGLIPDIDKQSEEIRAKLRAGI